MPSAETFCGFSVQPKLTAQRRARWLRLELALSGALGMAIAALALVLFTHHAQAAPFRNDAISEIGSGAATVVALMLASFAIAGLSVVLTRRSAQRSQR